jgi:hypothetical protein
VWRHIAQSLAGPGHAADGGICQDAHFVRSFGEGDSQVLIACVADGAGSARYSDIGAGLACAAVRENCEIFAATTSISSELGRDDVLSWCRDARKRIADDSEIRRCEPRELATTICAAIVTPSRTIFFQIGDGAIIVKHHGIYGVAFWPQQGEYANSTNFITSQDFEQRLEFYSTPTQFSDIALMTDGLERLALRFDTRTPHIPFFEPLFQALRDSKDLNRLNEDLRRFLMSDPVQSRSDDDKTLILASRDDRSANHAA